MKLISALYLLQAVLALLHPGQASRASVEGVVVSVAGHEPIAGAQVTLVSTIQGTGVSIPPTTSDERGRFRFIDVPLGTYAFNVLGNGYVRQIYDPRQPRAGAATISLKDGESIRSISVRLKPAGNVTGHVRNSAGRPVPGVIVRLVRRAYNANAEARFETVANARSDDRGEYRIYWVTPGRYYVVAGFPTRGSETFESRNPNEVAQNYLYTFFPGSTEFEKAIAIDVVPGAEVDSIDFPLMDAPLYRITGRAVDPATGQPPRQATATISQRTIGGTGSNSGGNSYNAESGTVQFGDVTPGIYNVSVRSGESAAQADVVISTADVDLGVLRLAPPRLITGRLIGDVPPLDSAQSNAIQVSLLDSTGISIEPRRGVQTRPQSDGTFTASVLYTKVRVTVNGLPRGYYVRQAMLDGSEALTSFAGVSSASRMEISLSSKAAEVNGTVQDESSRPAAGVLVVLVPDTMRHRPELFQETISDENGRFVLSGIAPGDYRIYAWESLQAYSYFDPDVLRKNEQQGRPVRAVESSRESIDLKMIPRGVD
jgi:hypothetical protein